MWEEGVKAGEVHSNFILKPSLSVISYEKVCMEYQSFSRNNSDHPNNKDGDPLLTLGVRQLANHINALAQLVHN